MAKKAGISIIAVMLFILTRISGYASEGFSQDCLGKPFRFEITPSSSYAAAARSCGDSGGRLMVLSNADLNQCVVNVIRAAGKEGYNFWIGLTRTGPGPTQFIWNDGVSLQTSNFANWEEGDPNNKHNGQECVYLWGDRHQLRWDDVECDSELASIDYWEPKGLLCEKLPANVTIPSS